MSDRVISDSDSGSCEEGLSKLIPGGNGHHPHPPPVARPPVTRQRTAGPRPPALREGRKGFRKTFGADVKHAN